MQASRMPDITLSLPAALGILALLIGVVGAGVFFYLRSVNPPSAEPLETPTVTATVTATTTPTEFVSPTPSPTLTPEPPFDYTVKAGESCSVLAFQFKVSIQSIVILNNLDSSCLTLREGQTVKIPWPTATPPPAPTATLPAVEATRDSCEKVVITVNDGDTLSSISLNYAVPAAAIKEYNGLTTDNVFIGSNLVIPLCMRAATPGPTPTATIPPPYPAPNLLLPADGAPFTLANDVVTLQWASVGTLRDGEAYQITVEDITADQTRRLTDFVADTKYIVPSSFRPSDNISHVFRWWITPVRQAGTDDQGQTIWVSAGATSDKRVFTWVGVAVQPTTSP